MALEYFQRAGVAEKIDARLGDARELVPEMKAQYDMIFMDAAKGPVSYTHLAQRKRGTSVQSPDDTHAAECGAYQ